jgi:hypothetical protein
LEKLDFIDKGETIEIRYKVLGLNFGPFSKFVREELGWQLNETGGFEIRK